MKYLALLCALLCAPLQATTIELRPADVAADAPGIVLDKDVVMRSITLANMLETLTEDEGPVNIDLFTFAELNTLKPWWEKTHELLLEGDSDNAIGTLTAKLIALSPTDLKIIIRTSDHFHIPQLYTAAYKAAAFILNWNNYEVFEELPGGLHIAIAQEFMHIHSRIYFPLKPKPSEQTSHNPLAGQKHQQPTGIELTDTQDRITGIDAQTKKPLFTIPAQGSFGALATHTGQPQGQLEKLFHNLSPIVKDTLFVRYNIEVVSAKRQRTSP